MLRKPKVRIDISPEKTIIFPNATYRLRKDDVIEISRGEAVVGHYGWGQIVGLSSIEAIESYSEDDDSEWLDDMSDAWGDDF